MDGINGWQYASFEQFSEKLDFILNQEGQHERLSKNARAGAIRDYSSAAFAEKVEQIYLDTISLHQKVETCSHALAM
jgi:1,2-diacylglycerol 3-alpha-glucosyltransferase